MTWDLDKEVAMLAGQTVPALKRRYHDVFGEQTRSNNKQFLIKRIAWRMQALREGDLSERARRRAMELANDADLRVRPPQCVGLAESTEHDPVRVTLAVRTDGRLPVPGAVLKRAYKGRTICVRVLGNGFEYEGRAYRSLSAVAREVTGSHWNGYHFFGLKDRSRRKEKAAL